MSMTVRHAVFVDAGVAALFLTWPFGFAWVGAGGNILNPVAFFADAIAPGGTAAFLAIDMAIAWLVFMIWVLFDAKRIGLGYKIGVLFILLSYIGVSMAFPFWLVTRAPPRSPRDGPARTGRRARRRPGLTPSDRRSAGSSPGLCR